MYSLNPALAQAWRELLQWVVERAGVDVEVIDHPPPQPLGPLWERPDMACAFMCGYPLARSPAALQVLAAPVPNPTRYGGLPRYGTDLVVRADSGIRTVEAAYGLRMAYTTPDSMSGYQAPRRHLADAAAARGGRLFSETVGPLLTPRRVVEAVLSGQADIGPLDGYAHDLLRLHEPALVAPLRTVASTAFVPIPPLVAAPGIDGRTVEGLRQALGAVATERALARLRAALLLRGFTPIVRTAYHATVAAADQADALGYRPLA